MSGFKPAAAQWGFQPTSDSFIPGAGGSQPDDDFIDDEERERV